ncbi:hypothetical protein J2TS4_24560 [Paenibacillus sp. J2TS4]|nr:hypothetical protein J2TS4_24560 [Paenibacillus sp. J2TS4]
MPDTDFHPPVPVETFRIGEIEWSYYSDELLRGVQDEMYYEVQTQGKFTLDLLKELLLHFKETNK